MLCKAFSRAVGSRQVLDRRRILRAAGELWVDGNERLAQSGRLAIVVAPDYAMPPCRQESKTAAGRFLSRLSANRGVCLELLFCNFTLFGGGPVRLESKSRPSLAQTVANICPK